MIHYISEKSYLERWIEKQQEKKFLANWWIKKDREQNKYFFEIFIIKTIILCEKLLSFLIFKYLKNFNIVGLCNNFLFEFIFIIQAIHMISLYILNIFYYFDILIYSILIYLKIGSSIYTSHLSDEQEIEFCGTNRIIWRSLIMHAIAIWYYWYISTD